MVSHGIALILDERLISASNAICSIKSDVMIGVVEEWFEYLKRELVELVLLPRE